MVNIHTNKFQAILVEKMGMTKLTPGLSWMSKNDLLIYQSITSSNTNIVQL